MQSKRFTRYFAITIRKYYIFLPSIIYKVKLTISICILDSVYEPDNEDTIQDAPLPDPDKNPEETVDLDTQCEVPQLELCNENLTPEKTTDTTILPETPSIPELDSEMLSALGEPTDDTPDFGENIHDNLAKLWLPLLKKGMPKENRDKILKDYLIPDNCRLLQAPKLNAEISAAVPDMVKNRDKNLAVSQQQLGSGITAINKAMHILLTSDNKIQAMKHLSNGCRILCDLHAASTQNRIKLLSPSLDKTILNIVQDTERDETIFGNKFSEKIKAAKAVERQGLQIKKVSVPKSSAPTQSSYTRPSYSGNWSAPQRYSSNRGGRGGVRRASTPSIRRPYVAPPPAKPAGQPRARAPQR